jgi:hypothetical protein
VHPHRLLCSGVGLLLALGAGAAVARAATSPIGLWKGENGRTYRWTALPGGGYAEYAVTSHRTSTYHCLVKANTLVYRYHPLGNGIYREDEFEWDKTCATSWALGYETIRIVVTPTRMTHSCDKQYAKVCFSYTRAATDTVAPVVHALASTGTAGGTTNLRYTVSDNSGRTWEELDIYRGVLIRRYRTTLGPALSGHVYAYKLTGTPASLKGKLTFCVHSHDAAGNVSKESCATLTIS